MNTKKNILASTIAFFMGSAVQGVVAQDEVGGQEENGWALEEIVVTAQKREERLLDVPISIATVNSEKLERTGVKNINDLSYLVPNLSVAELDSGTKYIIIRGIGNGLGSSPLVGMYLDEVPLSIHPAFAVDLQATDIERVEILRGPQGTLYGQGSIGGTIRFISKKPTFNKVEGMFGFSAYNTEGGGASNEATAIINLPVIDNTLAFRISASYHDKGGWIDQPDRGIEDANDSELSSAHLKGLLNISDKLNAEFSVIRYRNDSGSSNLTNIGSMADSIFRPIVRNGLDFPSTNRRNDYDIYNLTLEYDLGFASLISSSTRIDVENYKASLTTSILFAPDPGMLIDSVELDAVQSGDGYTQEVRLVGNINSLDWVAGVFYSDTDVFAGSSSFDRYINGNLLPGSIPNFKTINTSESIAVFFNLSYDFDERLTLALGSRYFEDKRSEKTPFFGTMDDGRFDNLSSKISANYSVAENASLYFSYSEGFRSGGFNAFSTMSFEPEEVKSFELGAKAALLNGQFIGEVAVFHSIYDNYQDSTIDSQGLGFIGNPGEARIQGVEWATRYKITDTFTVGLDGNITDSEFTEVANIDVPTVKVGDPVFLVPEYTYSLVADYVFNWSSSISGFAHVDYNRQGPNSWINRSAFLVKKTDESSEIGFLNAQLGAVWKDFRASLFARNINNELRKTNAALFSSRIQNRPRTFGIKISYQF